MHVQLHGSGVVHLDVVRTQWQCPGSPALFSCISRWNLAVKLTLKLLVQLCHVLVQRTCGRLAATLLGVLLTAGGILIFHAEDIKVFTARLVRVALAASGPRGGRGALARAGLHALEAGVPREQARELPAQRRDVLLEVLCFRTPGISCRLLFCSTPGCRRGTLPVISVKLCLPRRHFPIQFFSRDLEPILRVIDIPPEVGQVNGLGQGLIPHDPQKCLSERLIQL
mmetsp:Transcript_106074/g.257666  ORF Transcript_106074/g.257666 Transcript_106074/m.257666 type:complete len:226 (-) Transcript_106074:949-1626(-)